MDISSIVLFALIMAVIVASVLFVAYKRQQTRKLEVEEARCKAEEEARRQAEEATRLKAEEDSRRQAEESARLKAEEEARRQTEEAARLKAEEEARRQAEEAARLKAEEEALHQAEETRLKAEEEALHQAEETRLKAEEEAQRQAEVARFKAAEEARHQAEEAARSKAEEEARLQAEEAARLKAEEDARRQAEEAARIKTEEETRLQAEEAARLKAEEEARRQAEETRLKAEEEARRLEELAARVNATEEEMRRQTRLTPHRRSPEGRGGRPRESDDEDDQEKKEVLVKALREKTLTLRPEVVCWKAARKWFVGIELPEEYQEYAGIAVTQNDTQIDQDDRGRWILPQPSGIIQVSWDERGYPTDIRLNKPYLVFRITGQRENQGCFVQYATFGLYLVLVPDQWHRDEEISGTAIYSPESISIAGYQAHYFLLDRGNDSKIGFRTSTDEVVIVPTHASRFELIGSLLSDAHEDVGPLFAGHPPKIKAMDQKAWTGIKTIILGQEGSGRRRWRTHFAPEPDNIEQFFPTELNHRRGGWYFVRFYDAEDTLVESMDFRFTAALKEIVVTPHSSLPGPEGHLPVPVEFIHDSGCTIHLVEGNEEFLGVQHTATKTLAVIPPIQVWDRTRWSIIDTNNKILTEAVILVQRIWWAVGDNDFAKVQPHLSDKSLVVPCESFSATSKQFLWLRFPKERWVDTVLMGFSKERPRTYRVEVTKRRISIPLCDFEGSQELEDKFEEHSLNLWISFKGQALQQVTVIQIPPNKPLTQASVRQLLDVRPLPDETATKSRIPETRNFLDLPVDRKCCSTCTFATINDIGIRCIVGTWEERIDKTTFCDLFADHSCSRWFGEYTNSSGIMVTK
jgi:membrane protein involved in colicin uptake